MSLDMIMTLDPKGQRSRMPV